MNNWYLTDNDCSQYMRNDGTLYEMIECLWLDVTETDRIEGYKEYAITVSNVNMDDLYSEEIEHYIIPYGYTLETLYKEYTEEEARDFIAECVLEEDSMHNDNIIAEFNTFKEAEEFIKNYVNTH